MSRGQAAQRMVCIRPLLHGEWVPQRRNKVRVCFPAEWMNNKSFGCLAEAARGNGQKPQWESELTKKAHLIGFKYQKGREVRCLSNSADYCGLNGMHQDHMAFLCISSVLYTVSSYLGVVMLKPQKWFAGIEMHCGWSRYWPLLRHGKPVLVFLALLGVLLHGGAGVGNKCLLHGLPHS